MKHTLPAAWYIIYSCYLWPVIVCLWTGSAVSLESYKVINNSKKWIIYLQVAQQNFSAVCQYAVVGTYLFTINILYLVIFWMISTSTLDEQLLLNTSVLWSLMSLQMYQTEKSIRSNLNSKWYYLSRKGGGCVHVSLCLTSTITITWQPNSVIWYTGRRAVWIPCDRARRQLLHDTPGHKWPSCASSHWSGFISACCQYYIRAQQTLGAIALGSPGMRWGGMW